DRRRPPDSNEEGRSPLDSRTGNCARTGLTAVEFKQVEGSSFDVSWSCPSAVAPGRQLSECGQVERASQQRRKIGARARHVAFEQTLQLSQQFVAGVLARIFVFNISLVGAAEHDSVLAGKHVLKPGDTVSAAQQVL